MTSRRSYIDERLKEVEQHLREIRRTLKALQRTAGTLPGSPRMVSRPSSSPSAPSSGSGLPKATLAASVSASPPTPQSSVLVRSGPPLAARPPASTPTVPGDRQRFRRYFASASFPPGMSPREERRLIRNKIIFFAIVGALLLVILVRLLA